MLIDITDFYHREDPSLYAASVAECGDDAAHQTWTAAMRAAEEYNHIGTPDQIEAFKKFLQQFGAWSEAEVEGWTHQQLNAVFIQWAAGDMREGHMHGTPEDDWHAYYQAGVTGQIACNLEEHSGRIYFYLER